MPTYEYACTACGERTEAKQSFDDPPLEECPTCGGRLRKLYSPVGIVFKGSGFYATDGRKGAKSQADPKAPGEKGSKSESKGSTTETGSGSGSKTKTEASKEKTG